MPEAALALGANLGDAPRTVARAIEALDELPQTRVVSRSSLYRSAALGPPQPDYINAAAMVETELSPHDLLTRLQAIEVAFGRAPLSRRRGQRWSARELDLDIITFADKVLNDERLVVPHSQAWRRCFVLAPLAEIAPTLTLPNYGCVLDLLKTCDTGAVEALENDGLGG